MRIRNRFVRNGTLLIASPGGHVDELRILGAHADLPGPVTWITSSTAHTVGVLAGLDVRWVAQIGPRELRPALAALPSAHRLMRELAPAAVVSTGAALAVPYLLAARAHRIPTYFVDSATRFDAPSLTGRIVETLPGVVRYSQDESWGARRGWAHLGSVFDAFEPEASSTRPITKVVVTLGGEKFAFPRAVRAVRRAIAGLPEKPRITWQLGSTSVAEDFGPDAVVHDFMDPMDLRAEIAAADLVIAHAGVGSVLTALESGRSPVVLPRVREHGEHVDGHQWQLALRLAERGLVFAVDPDALAPDLLVTAAAQTVAAREASLGLLR